MQLLRWLFLTGFLAAPVSAQARPVRVVIETSMGNIEAELDSVLALMMPQAGR